MIYVSKRVFLAVLNGTQLNILISYLWAVNCARLSGNLCHLFSGETMGLSNLLHIPSSEHLACRAGAEQNNCRIITVFMAEKGVFKVEE